MLLRLLLLRLTVQVRFEAVPAVAGPQRLLHSSTTDALPCLLLALLLLALLLLLLLVQVMLLLLRLHWLWLLLLPLMLLLLARLLTVLLLWPHTFVSCSRTRRLQFR
jgi:hypothetical protein